MSEAKSRYKKGSIYAARTTTLLMAASCFHAYPAMAAKSITLEEVVVTAQKREESLQDVPIAVTALSGSDIGASGIGNTQDLAIRVPGLTTSLTIGYVQPRIRGVGTTANGPGVENPVAVYVDGVYIASAPGSLFSFSDIERIETLKGPQGTLFGRNSTGGLINVITREPEFDVAGRMSIGYGSYDTSSVSGYVTGPLGDSVAGSLSVLGNWQGEGYGTNSGTGHDANKKDKDIAVRTKLLIEGDKTKAVLSLDYAINEGSPLGLRGWGDTGFLFGPPTPGDEWDTATDTDFLNEYEGSGASLRIEHDLGNLSLVSITGYRRSQFDFLIDYDMTALPAFTIGLGQQDKQFSQELQLNSNPESTIQWVTGLYYFNAEAEAIYNNASLFGPLVAPTAPRYPVMQIQSPGEQTTESIAGFFQATAPLTETTNLTIGLRYTEEERTIEGQQSAVIVGGIPIGPIGPAIDDDNTFEALTWRLALDHALSDKMMVYASYNRGFKSGGFNVLALGEKAYGTEELDAYEIGMKSEFLDGRARANVAVFYYDYANIQVPFYATGQLSIRNGPEAEITGLDAELTVAVSENLTLTTGLSILDASFGDYPDAVITTEIPAVGISNQGFGDASDNELPYTPDWTLNLAADYVVPLSVGELLLNVSYLYNDGFYSEADNLRAQDDFQMVNASIKWSSSDESYSVSLWGKNLANEAVVNQLSGTAFVANFATYQPPRTYGITLESKF